MTKLTEMPVSAAGQGTMVRLSSLFQMRRTKAQHAESVPGSSSKNTKNEKSVGGSSFWKIVKLFVSERSFQMCALQVHLQFSSACTCARKMRRCCNTSSLLTSGHLDKLLVVRGSHTSSRGKVHNENGRNLPVEFLNFHVTISKA